MSESSLWPRRRHRDRTQPSPGGGAVPGPSHSSRASSCPGSSSAVDPGGRSLRVDPGTTGQRDGERGRSLRQKLQDAVGLCLAPPRPRSVGPLRSKRRVHSETRNGSLKPDLNHWDLDMNLNRVRTKSQLRDLDRANGNCPPSWDDPHSPAPGAGGGVEGGALSAERDQDQDQDQDLDPDCVLVPDLLQISNSACYWGVLDRVEAEAVLEGTPEGTFLLRDSAHSELLFSVSFRRYSRSLHARIEQSGRAFSFDGRDPGMYRDPRVGGLLRHYSNPHACLFFEPLLAHPLPRPFPFSLQHLTRCVICSCTTFSGLQTLPLPPHLRDYLTHYHLKT